MPKLRITDKGFKNYSGVLGGVVFKDGVSLESVSQLEAERMGSIVKMECAETGSKMSVTQRMIDTRRKSLGDFDVKHETLEKKPSKKATDKKPSKKATDKKPEDLDMSYTRESLEAIADDGGLAGIRNFARPYNVRGTTIPSIIDGMMQKQKSAQDSEK